MSVVPNEPPTSPVAHYEPAQPPISRRSFRLLLLLTFINTMLLGLYVLGPGLHGFVREQWSAYQQWRTDRQRHAQESAARRAMLPAQQQCLSYQAPPGTLVYAEDPAGIARLNFNGQEKRLAE